MPNDEPQILAAVRRYVMPERRYMKLHGWNIAHMGEEKRDEFGRSLAKAASRAADHEIIALLKSDWRASLAAAWLIAIDMRTGFRDIISNLLLQQEGSNQLKGYCFALTRFGSPADAEAISSYLDKSLRLQTRNHAETWALGGLLYLDAQLESSYADRFLATNAWPSWSSQEPDEYRLIQTLCNFANTYGSRSEQPGNNQDIRDRFDAWKPHHLPTPWLVVQGESERRRIDATLGAHLASISNDSLLEPLSIAKCRECHAVLFNTAPKHGDWIIMPPSSHANDKAEHSVISAIEELKTRLEHHSH
ncbi:DUF6000 family protein [Streptomyces sp. PR69]|uniref:DUF6000 family protein n=1 Tax=Streptomyces sp. PR69 TaxID=2984950 RepID=UPI0022645ACD|nr:DUF6000 family protein [Streptomyces sp. PR69]